jgi:hypothetical protein
MTKFITSVVCHIYNKHKSSSKSTPILCIFSIVLVLFVSIIQNSYEITLGTISEKSASPKIVFTPWGNESKLILKSSPNGSSTSILKLEGTTGKSAAGFVSNDLDYRGSLVTLKIGKVSKSPVDAKVSFTLDIKGLFKDYTMLFVIGRGESKVWVGDVYFQKLDPHTTSEVNIPDIIALHNGLYLITKRITLVVEKQTSIKGIDFTIQLDPINANDLLIK